MFANGIQPDGSAEVQGIPRRRRSARARGRLVDQFAGRQCRGRPFILEGGATWQAIQMNADDAQLLESRAWSVEDICRWFGTPPPMIGHTTKTTSWPTGLEQQVLLYQKFG
jgi:HK97 family phage portal protein